MILPHFGHLVQHLEHIPSGEYCDFGKDVFPELLKKGEGIAAHESHEYIKDMGTPDRLDETTLSMASGVVSRMNRENPQRAVFLDRDGVINREVGNLSTPEQLELLPRVGEAVGKINQAGYLVVVFTNQPVIAKGFCNESDLNEIHKKLEWLLGLEHAFVDAIYYCPHHPDRGFRAIQDGQRAAEPPDRNSSSIARTLSGACLDSKSCSAGAWFCHVVVACQSFVHRSVDCFALVQLSAMDWMME